MDQTSDSEHEQEQERWHSCFVIRLSSNVAPELPKTATGKVQKYVLRGKPAISKQ